MTAEDAVVSMAVLAFMHDEPQTARLLTSLLHDGVMDVPELNLPGMPDLPRSLLYGAHAFELAARVLSDKREARLCVPTWAEVVAGICRKEQEAGTEMGVCAALLTFVLDAAAHTMWALSDVLSQQCGNRDGALCGCPPADNDTGRADAVWNAGFERIFASPVAKSQFLNTIAALRESPGVVGAMKALYREGRCSNGLFDAHLPGYAQVLLDKARLMAQVMAMRA